MPCLSPIKSVYWSCRFRTKNHFLIKQRCVHGISWRPLSELTHIIFSDLGRSWLLSPCLTHGDATITCQLPNFASAGRRPEPRTLLTQKREKDTVNAHAHAPAHANIQVFLWLVEWWRRERRERAWAWLGIRILQALVICRWFVITALLFSRTN